jgi:hypothetical protein
MTETNAQPQEAPSINLNDVEAVIRIIDVSVERGAIRGEEMLAVGTIRQRFADFYQYVKASQEPEEEQTEE